MFLAENCFSLERPKVLLSIFTHQADTLSLDPELELESLNREENPQNNIDIEEERQTLLGLHENHLSSNSNQNNSISTIWQKLKRTVQSRIFVQQDDVF